MSLTDGPERAVSGSHVPRIGLNGTGGPVEHVTARCPVLIATLEAIADAGKHEQTRPRTLGTAHGANSVGDRDVPIVDAGKRWAAVPDVGC